MDKNIPRNPRYANVKGKIDTGKSASKVRVLNIFLFDSYII